MRTALMMSLPEPRKAFHFVLKRNFAHRFPIHGFSTCSDMCPDGVAAEHRVHRYMVRRYTYACVRSRKLAPFCECKINKYEIDVRGILTVCNPGRPLFGISFIQSVRNIKPTLLQHLQTLLGVWLSNGWVNKLSKRDITICRFTKLDVRITGKHA